MSVSFNFHSQARPLPTQTITVEAPLSVQTPALVLRLRAPVESSNIEMKRSDIINCLVKEILSNKVLNDAEKVVIQDSASCINLQKLDSLETEKIRRAVSFALCDLLLVGIDPVIARTHDDQLVEAESIIEEVLVETVPNNETVKSYLDKYEMYLAKQIVQKKNKDEANKVENGVQQQIQKVVQADKQVDESRVAHVVQLGSSLTNINNQRKVVAV